MSLRMAIKEAKSKLAQMKKVAHTTELLQNNVILYDRVQKKMLHETESDA